MDRSGAWSRGPQVVEIYVAIPSPVVTKTGDRRLTVPEAVDFSIVTQKPHSYIRIAEIRWIARRYFR